MSFKSVWLVKNPDVLCCFSSMMPSLTPRVLGLPKLNRVRSLNFALVCLNVGFSLMCHFNKKGQFHEPASPVLDMFHNSVPASPCRGPEHVTPLQKFSWQSPRSVSSLIRVLIRAVKKVSSKGLTVPWEPLLTCGFALALTCAPGQLCSSSVCTISHLHESGPHPGLLTWHPGLASDLPCHCSPAGWPHGLCLTLTTVSPPNLGPGLLLHILAPCWWSDSFHLPWHCA